MTSGMVLFVAVLGTAAAQVHHSHGAFCDFVKSNHGCCPACGYHWDHESTKCVSKEPATSAYCKELLEPEHGGCCEYCKYKWSAGESKCVSTVDLSSPAELALLATKADDDHAAFARKMVKSLTWGVLSTTSTRTQGTSMGASFGNPYSFADVAGVPYFYASDMDASMIDLFGSEGAGASARASLALSHASLMLDNGTAAEAACRIGDGLGDPENPPCARLVISGTMTKVQTGSAEDEAARAALFERHASFKNYPKDHGFYVAKMTLDGVWLISAYGGAAILRPEDYFAAPVSAMSPKAQAESASSPVVPAEHKTVPTYSDPSPWPWQHGKKARWMVSSLVWGVLSTTSTRAEGTSAGDSFGNPYSFADVGGVPYFYASGLDASMIDLFGSKSTSTRASLSLSEAALGGSKSFVWREKCKIGTTLGDPENPPCTRLVLTGTMSKVEPSSDEEGVARAALFKKHPSFAMYPKDHGFYVAKMDIETLWLIDMYGGAIIVSPGEYFDAGNSSYMLV